MYPAASSWISTEDGSAWFYRDTPGAGRRACSTTGWDALVDVQTEVYARLQALGPKPTWTGDQVNADSVPNTANDPAIGWNMALLQALYAVASVDMHSLPQGVQTSYLNAVLADAEYDRISAQTLALALWVAYVSHDYDASGADTFGNGSPAQVIIPAGTALPAFNTPPPMPPARAGGTVQAGVRCVAAGTVAGGATTSVMSGWMTAGIIGLGIFAVLMLTKNVTVKKRSR